MGLSTAKASTVTPDTGSPVESWVTRPATLPDATRSPSERPITSRSRSRSLADWSTTLLSAPVMTSANTDTAARSPSSASPPRGSRGRCRNVPNAWGAGSQPVAVKVSWRILTLPAMGRRADTFAETAAVSPGSRRTVGGTNSTRVLPSGSTARSSRSRIVLPSLRTVTPSSADRPPVIDTGSIASAAAASGTTTSSTSPSSTWPGGVSSVTCSPSVRVPAGMPGGRVIVTTTVPDDPGNSWSESTSVCTQRASTPRTSTRYAAMTSPVLNTDAVTTIGWPGVTAVRVGATSMRIRAPAPGSRRGSAAAPPRAARGRSGSGTRSARRSPSTTRAAARRTCSCRWSGC